MSLKKKLGGPILVQPKPKQLSTRAQRRNEVMAAEGLSRREFAQRYGSSGS